MNPIIRLKRLDRAMIAFALQGSTDELRHTPIEVDAVMFGSVAQAIFIMSVCASDAVTCAEPFW